MKKPLRTALVVVLFVVGFACSALLPFHKFGNLPTSQRDALFILAFALPSIAWSLMTAAIAVSKAFRAARFICTGISCAFFIVGAAALFIPMSESFLDFVGAAAGFNLSATIIISLIAQKARKKKNQPPQETPT